MVLEFEGLEKGRGRKSGHEEGRGEGMRRSYCGLSVEQRL